MENGEWLTQNMVARMRAGCCDADGESAARFASGIPEVLREEDRVNLPPHACCGSKPRLELAYERRQWYGTSLLDMCGIHAF